MYREGVVNLTWKGFNFKLILMRGKLSILIIFLAFFLSSCQEEIEEARLEGSFYTNDSGSARGGFEWAGEYRARLEIFNGSGTLYLEQVSGLGDPLTRHDLKVEEFKMDDKRIEMKINGSRAVLLWTEKDKIWNGEYNFHYIGNNSINPSEKIGTLSPSSFPGLPEHYYVEIRLKR